MSLFMLDRLGLTSLFMMVRLGLTSLFMIVDGWGHF